MLDYSATSKLGHVFELGPIRPPSEAYSLLIRATRNCPWNRCQFCPVYKGSRFELRPVGEIMKDIEAVRAISEGIREMAWQMGCGDAVREVAATICNEPRYGQCVCHVAQWLAAGGRTAFLQDSNTLIMRTPELIQVISFLRSTFPSIDRVTAYGRSHTAARKSLTELAELKDAGLDRVHIGLETGYDPLLAYMQKGCTARNHIEGGNKVKNAGISLCEYVMPGLGGRQMSQDHVRESARVLNEIDPDYIRLRSLHVSAAMPLWAMLQKGDFDVQTEDEIVGEIAVLVQNLNVNSYLKSDHILNLLEEVDGKMPEDRERCLDVIGKYLSLPDDERLSFKVGRRVGLYSRLTDLHDDSRRERVEQVINHLRQQGNDIEQQMFRLKSSFI